MQQASGCRGIWTPIAWLQSRCSSSCYLPSPLSTPSLPRVAPLKSESSDLVCAHSFRRERTLNTPRGPSSEYFRHYLLKWKSTLICIIWIKGLFKYGHLMVARVQKRHLIVIQILGVLKVTVSAQIHCMRIRWTCSKKWYNIPWGLLVKPGNWKHVLIFTSHGNVSKMTVQKFKGINHMDKEKERGDDRK